MNGDVLSALVGATGALVTGAVGLAGVRARARKTTAEIRVLESQADLTAVEALQRALAHIEGRQDALEEENNRLGLSLRQERKAHAVTRRRVTALEEENEHLKRLVRHTGDKGDIDAGR